MKGMRIVSKIVLCFGAVITGLLGLIFTFIEGRTLFTGDAMALYANPVSGIFVYLFRTLIAIAFAANAIFCLIKIHKMDTVILFEVIFGGCLFVTACFSSALLSQFYISYLWIMGTLFLLIGAILSATFKKE